MINKVCLRLYGLIGLIFLSPFVCANETAALPVIKNLQQFSEIAEKRDVPILILFSMEDCEWCEIIRSEYLLPMQSRKEDRSRILMGELFIEAHNYVRDFDGKLISADNIGLRYMADLSPTLVFVDAEGNELVKRIIGFKGRDYYDHVLDNAIKQSIKKISH
jgi:thioredoxin-related protein